MKWYVLSYETLSLDQLYAILQLRQDVFILEQKCLYRDIDGCDKQAKHLLAMDNNILQAYLRLFEPNDQNIATIGRVVSRQRGKGLGKKLFTKGLYYLQEHYPEAIINIAAQFYLKNFYQEFGFKQISEPYLEDDIEHIDMSYKPK